MDATAHCSLCNTDFTRRHNLYKHRKNIHNLSSNEEKLNYLTNKWKKNNKIPEEELKKKKASPWKKKMTVEIPPTCIPEKPSTWVPPFEARPRSTYPTINFDHLAFSIPETDGTSKEIEPTNTTEKILELNEIQEDLFEESWKQLAAEFNLITYF
ncbi:hypothetical protein SNE40_016111 [Patella caerulea]|uniref:C2H2-type domain-containing protein n=1 Tax=Patella caerulea TaxID=87958 RepID=A0AAN8J890_PATCE